MITELYRYRAQGTSDYMSLDILLDAFPVIKETKQGYWIDIHGVGWIKGQLNFKTKKWVAKESGRKFAYQTKEEAMVNFLARKDKQIRIVKKQLSQAKAEKREILKMMAEFPTIKLPKRLAKYGNSLVI